MTEAALRTALRDATNRAYAAGWNDGCSGFAYDPAPIEADAEDSVLPIAADLVQEALEVGFTGAREPLAADPDRVSHPVELTVVLTFAAVFGCIFWRAVLDVLRTVWEAY